MFERKFNVLEPGVMNLIWLGSIMRMERGNPAGIKLHSDKRVYSTFTSPVKDVYTKKSQKGI